MLEIGGMPVGAIDAEDGAKLGLAHEQHARQYAQEERLDPLGHGVSGRRAEVHVEHDDRDEYGEGDEYHGEEQVLADERHHERRGRYELGEQEEEDGEREQDAHAQ